MFLQVIRDVACSSTAVTDTASSSDTCRAHGRKSASLSSVCGSQAPWTRNDPTGCSSLLLDCSRVHWRMFQAHTRQSTASCERPVRGPASARLFMRCGDFSPCLSEPSFGGSASVVDLAYAGAWTSIKRLQMVGEAAEGALWYELRFAQ